MAERKREEIIRQKQKQQWVSEMGLPYLLCFQNKHSSTLTTSIWKTFSKDSMWPGCVTHRIQKARLYSETWSTLRRKTKRNGEGHSVRYSGSHVSAALSSKRCDCTLEEVRRSWVRAYANAMHKGTREALQLIIFALRHLVFTPAATFAPTILHLIFQKSSSLIRIWAFLLCWLQHLGLSTVKKPAQTKRLYHC